jgi:hypothetical protein
MLTPVMQWSGGGINPLYDNDWAVDNVAMPGGRTFKAGQVLGFVAGTGAPVSEIQTITINYTPTGGSFYLIYGTIVIGPIAFNATAAAVATAINAALGTNTVVGGGGPLPGTPVTATFQNEAAGMAHIAMIPSSQLTGGTPGTIAVTRSTPGKPAGGYYDAYVDTVIDPARRIARYDVTANQFGNVTIGQTDLAGMGGIANRAVPTYFKGYFRCSDLIGLDAAGVVDLGKLINGTAFTDSGAVLCVTGA